MQKSEQTLTDDKVYELILGHKDNTENKRDEINKYYISLFTTIISVIPFIDKFTGAANESIATIIKIGGISLIAVGIILSISWTLSLKRMHYYIKAIDLVLSKIEEKQNQEGFTFIKNYLTNVKSPGRITKQELIIPYSFTFLFVVGLFYSISLILFK